MNVENGVSMKKLSKKTKFRVAFLVTSLIITCVVFVSSTFSYFAQIHTIKQEINNLNKTYNEKLSYEEELKDEINKLQDPEYMARYAREKYLYSKKGEIIIKIED